MTINGEKIERKKITGYSNGIMSLTGSLKKLEDASNRVASISAKGTGKINGFDPNDTTGMTINGKTFEVKNIKGYSKEVVKLTGYLKQLEQEAESVKIPELKPHKLKKNQMEQMYEDWGAGKIDLDTIKQYKKEQEKIEQSKLKITGYRGNISENVNPDVNSFNLWDTLRIKIEQLKPAIERIKQAFKNVFSSKQTKQTSAELELVKYKISEIEEKLEKAKNGEIHLKIKEIREAEAQLERLNNKKEKLENGNKGKFFSGLKKTTPSMNNVAGITVKIKNTIKQWNSDIKNGLGHVLKYASALFSMQSIYSALSGAAHTWLSSQNAQAQQLSANIEYMKYAMGSVFAPVIQFVTNLIYNLMKAVQSLVYAFSGVNIFAKATANSMKSASGSAKQTNKSLSSVHSEINNVSDNNSNGNGSTTPSIDLSQMDNSMLTWANKWKEKLSKFFIPFKEAWNNQGQKTIDSAKNAFEKTKEAVISVGKSWNEVWSNGTGQKTIELILQIFQNVCDIIANIAEAWNNAWNNDNRGTELIQTMWNALNKLLELIRVLTEKIKEFTSNPIVQQYFQNAIEMVTNFWNALGGLIEFLTGIFTGDWEKTWNGLKDFVSGIFGMIWNAINSKILMIQAIISNVLEGIKNTWSNIWDGIKNFATNIWDNLLNKIDSIFPGMRNIIETNITNAKNKINEVLNSIKSIWNNIWSGIKNKTSEIWNNIWSAIKNPINWILGGIEKMANGVVTGVNKVIRSLNNMHFKMPDWLGGGSFGINIPTMSGVSLPRLAKGNVAYDETLAVFGEYSGARNNPEITAPQSVLKETFEDVLSDFNSGNGQPLHLTIQYLGKEIFDDTIDYINSKTRRTGKNTIVTVGD